MFHRALALREALHRIFKATVMESTPQSIDVETLNGELLKARNHERLSSTDKGFTWEWTGSEIALDRMLWSIALSGAEFLSRGDLSRLRECGGEECGWLFEDTSRNRSRQWCHMQDCGNLAKVHPSAHVCGVAAGVRDDRLQTDVSYAFEFQPVLKRRPLRTDDLFRKFYCTRSASIGSTRVARRAGNRQATMATATSPAQAAESSPGLNADTS